jgi:hypothetical protein
MFILLSHLIGRVSSAAMPRVQFDECGECAIREPPEARLLVVRRLVSEGHRQRARLPLRARYRVATSMPLSLSCYCLYLRLASSTASIRIC